MAVKFKDYYDVLGTSKTATEDDIRKAYRSLARKYHPDVNPGDKSAEERFKEINEAYEVLSDPDRRKRYDELGPNWKAGSDFTPPPGWQNAVRDLMGLATVSPRVEVPPALAISSKVSLVADAERERSGSGIPHARGGCRC